MRESISATAAFRTASARFAARLAGVLHCSLPFEPDSNLVCLALNPVGNRSVTEMNRYVRCLFQSLRSDPRTPLQSREFFGSMTTLNPQALGASATRSLLDALDLDGDSLDNESEDADRLIILRHTLMNPFLIDSENGISYIEGYFRYLESQVLTICQAGQAASQVLARKPAKVD
jgi:hypothetical protein